MYEAFTLNPSASSMTCITPDTSESIPSLNGLNVTVCPSIFSRGIGSLTVGGLYPINEEDQTALGSSKAIFDCRLQLAQRSKCLSCWQARQSHSSRAAKSCQLRRQLRATLLRPRCGSF